MQVVSAKFFLIIVATLLACSVLPPQRRKAALLAGSYAFYAWWNVPYWLLLCAATLAAYGAARAIDAAATDAGRRWALTGALIALLGTLAVFKYAGVLASLAGGGAQSAWALSRIVLPLGISYYTFKLISYVIDVYWGKYPAERDLVAFAVYPAFFPHILSGPIQRADDFLAQIRRPVANDPALVTSGLRLMLFGYFKIVVVAETLAPIVRATFAEPHQYTSAAMLVGCYAFVFQLYADFSGFTDVAIGVSRLLGIQTPPNFDQPFTATNIQVLWRRFHMTLTRWLADYLFLPLRIAFRGWGAAGLAAALVINFVAMGLWHAATWPFLAYGLLHALFICVSVFTLAARDAWFARHPALAPARRIWAPLLTFQLWTAAEILFRSESLAQAGDVFTSILSLHTAGLGTPPEIWMAVPAVAAMEIGHWLRANEPARLALRALPAAPRWALYYACLLTIMIFDHFGRSGFIYVRF